MKKEIELLSPAKNLECAIAAINHGADAVYIGASQFGARVAAGNSIADIEEVCKYAHKFRAKVFVTLNTLLTNEQLPDAEKLIHSIYNAGADALIIQDMGILEMNLPPIALHASTQTDNRTIEKVQFLEKAGLSRVVLARELSLKQITEIATNTKVELEAFVHGALCVSYSGQCYISQATCGRSANRGNCAQFCRLPYDLTDKEGNILAKDKHLLSLKDLNLSAHLEEMMQAGISSFKIEGRLKDVNYVKNITAYYRKKLDVIFEGNNNYKKASVGKTYFFFEPDVEKSFNRGFTTYFIENRKNNIIQPNTPKSLGEEIGRIIKIKNNSLEVETNKTIHNGDGLCFFDKEEKLKGFKVNKVENNLIFPAEMPYIEQGCFIYRNFDADFDRQLQQKTADRKISLHIIFKEIENGFSIILTDEEGISSTFSINTTKEPAKKTDGILKNITTQLGKLGNTIYEAENIEVLLNQPYFIPTSHLNEWRRNAIEQHELLRDKLYIRPKATQIIEDAVFPVSELTYLGNVTNKLAEKFYKKHEVKSIDYGFEIHPQENVPLMFCKHCIKFALNMCPKQGNEKKANEPLLLKNQHQIFQLHFNCQKCEMSITKKK